MHEMSIAQSLVDILEEEMTRHDANTLKSVRLHVGQLSAIVPHSLTFCFQVITKGTPMEDAKLIIDVISLRGACAKCQKTFEIRDYHFVCPQCGSSDIKTIAGQDLSIVEMEVD
jgi:hydrogenase nickel incorporation protein HypA/HybF